MLDITRSHIVLMEPAKDKAEKAKKSKKKDEEVAAN